MATFTGYIENTERPDEATTVRYFDTEQLLVALRAHLASVELGDVIRVELVAWSDEYQALELGDDDPAQ